MSFPTTKAGFRTAIDIAMGVLPRPLYQKVRKTYLTALKAGYAAGYSRVQMTYAREFLCSVRRMRIPR